MIAAKSAHINVDEGGAPERVGGMKLLTVPTPDGKLTPALIDQEAWGWGDEHRAQPLAVSITQSTELGTLYTAAEIRAIADHAHERGMLLHVDGARLANAAVSLGAELRAFTTDAGVDILSLGGTKNGAMGQVASGSRITASASLPNIRIASSAFSSAFMAAETMPAQASASPSSKNPSPA